MKNIHIIKLFFWISITQFLMVSCENIQVDSLPTEPFIESITRSVIPTEKEIQTLQPTETITPNPPTPTSTGFESLPYIEEDWQHFKLDDYVPTEVLNQGNMTNAIAFSPEGIAWVGTSAGLWRFKEGSWTSFLQDDGLINDGIGSISIGNDGDIWVGSTSEGISHFDGISWQTYPGLEAQSIKTTSDGNVWVSHYIHNDSTEKRTTVFYFDGIKWHPVDIGVDNMGNNIEAWRLTVSPDGVVWVGTRRHGIIKIIGQEISRFSLSTFESYPNSGGVCGFCVGAIDIAPNGTLWTIIATKGLVHYDGESWETYPYFTNGGPKAIDISRDGRLWVGEVFGHVVSFMEESKWYTFSDLPFNKVYDVKVNPDGTVWFATGSGLFIYTRK